MNRPLLCCLVTALALASTLSGRAAATLLQQVDPVEVKVGDEVILAITIQGGSVNQLHVPKVAGLEVVPIDDRASSTSIDTSTGDSSTSVIVRAHLLALQAGDFTIPAFDINLKDGGILRTKPATIHVLAGATAPPPDAPAATQPENVQQPPAFNPVGPVVMPDGNGPANANSTVNVPTDADGHPLKLFMVITPDTTDTYVGQAVPMHIDFYLRHDINARQDSIPTIDGSDFMMNPIERPAENDVVIQNQPYHHEAWLTAISAPKSGDFPLVMERDTYWLKSSNPNNPDFFNSFTGPDIAHGPVGSNRLMIHVRPLPEEGRPAHFSGVIGHLKISGDAAPLTVSVGEPVTVRFAVSGDANFTYVRCPSLAADPAWKSYVPSARTQYLDEYHTQGTKTFDQAVIPQKGGILPLPAASFSYFDPTAKQYVTTQMALPDIAVTGSRAVIPPPPAGVDNEATASPPVSTLAPNRASLGFLADNFLPAYRQPWFWAVQGSLLSALCLSAIFTFMRRRTLPDEEDSALVQRRKSLHAEEDAMGLAVRNGDAHAFFLAARHAVQLQLGTQWKVSPEALTLGELHRRDPRLARTLEPLFIQADEVIYSGGTTGKLDLAQWERHVRSLLQSQLQPA